MFRLSKYTIMTTDDEGGALWYNAATGERRCLTPGEARLASAWATDSSTLPEPGVPASGTGGGGDPGESAPVASSNGSGERVAAREAALADELIRKGFFVDAARRETRDILVRLKAERRARAHLGLTVLATLDCNLACPYCVVRTSQGAGYMSARVQRRLLSWWKEQLPGRRSCSLDWMGGEPLLYPDAFWALCNELLAIARSEGVRVIRHAMATNGVSVTPELADQLRSLGMNHIQITLDGPESYHDRSRPMASGGGSYRRIVEGLKAVVPACRVQVRVNLTTANSSGFEPLLDELAAEGLAGKVGIYPARVFEPEHRKGALPVPTLDREAFARAATRFAVAAMERGFPPPLLPPPSTGGFCGAYRSSHFVVGPRGLLYGCPGQVTAGGEYAVGSIFSPDRTSEQEVNQAFYDQYGPTKANGCFTCKLLPICLGGCPEVVRASGVLDDGCVPWRDCLDTQLVIEHEWMKLTKEEPWNEKRDSSSR